MDRRRVRKDRDRWTGLVMAAFYLVVLPILVISAFLLIKGWADLIRSLF